MNEEMFELAMVVSRLTLLGYEFVEVKSGEPRLEIGPTLILRKDGKEIKCYDIDELEDILRKYWDEKNDLF